MTKGNLRYWELSVGGDTGSILMDASAATAIATGLQVGLIDVHDDTIFTTLLGWDVSTATAIDFRVDNNLSGITRKAGLLAPGYGRYFTDISINPGQLSHYRKRDD